MGKSKENDNITYQSGFGGHFSSEAIKNALPVGQNAPQKAPYGLYAEQLSGSAFTRPRAHNKRSWLYRILPSVVHEPYEPISHSLFSEDYQRFNAPLNQVRWDPFDFGKQSTHFIQGCRPFALNGDPVHQDGGAIYLYHADQNMQDTFFFSADGEWLIIPWQGRCQLSTEFGPLEIAPGDIAVIPRGVKFQVNGIDNHIQGYICENFAEPFSLPDLGPIGANGLANPRDFLYPCARFEEKEGDYTLICKHGGQLWQASISHSPLDVVAWHGNYLPYKYPLSAFNTINTVSYDHCDPSIFTVLTSQTAVAGLANIDFVIFPDRWMVAENTFRPPYFHRNIMSEFMGLIKGQYDAKQTGFLVGGCSIHNCMTAHGPDTNTTQIAIEQPLTPTKQENTLAFMLESRLPWRVAPWAMEHTSRQQDYQKCWKNMAKRFKS